MNFSAVKELVTNKTAHQLLLARKHSPKALFVIGTVGVVGTVILACRATLKVSDTIDELDSFKERLDKEELTESFTESDRERMHKTETVTTALKIVKLYAPAVGVGLISIAALTGSHIILTKRNASVMALYAALDQAHKQYRSQVVEKYGEEVDRDFAIGAENVMTSERMADGTTKTDTKKVVDPKKAGSPWRVLFDVTTSRKFTTEPGKNAMILEIQQSHANHLLRAQGHLFLNEVFDMLGLPRTKAGAVAGWVWRRETEEKTGDNMVDFGIFSGDLESARRFVNGYEDAVWLDFNVDGVIIDLI